MKQLIKKLVPERAVITYHRGVTTLASYRYGLPAKKMVIIGITGTKGKTSTANFVWSCLMAAGYKTGLVGTANIRIGETELLNKYHMTMPGRAVLQQLMADMVKANCTHCIIEVTSEGLKQWRHQGVDFDVAIFTNLTPEHLPSHGGSFEKYKEAKGALFAALMQSPRKVIEGKKVNKLIIANADSEHADYYLTFPADKKVTYGIKNKANYVAAGITSTDNGVIFNVDSTPYELHILGEFNVYNALPAIALAVEWGIPREQIQAGLGALSLIPGRMERIANGIGAEVIVDYAHEKESMTALLTSAQKMKKKSEDKIIVLLGAEGGGRDKAKRPAMGEVAAKLADYVVVSNVDPYSDNPTEIAEDIAKASEVHGKQRDKNLFVIEDRRAGIRKTLELAKKGDIVLITGKGAEQSITVDGVTSPWDDRTVVKEELRNLGA